MRRGIFARQLTEICAAFHALIADPRQITGGVFHAHDVFMLGQNTHGFRCHIHNRPARNVIDHNRQVHRIGHSGVMGDQSALGRFVVIGRDHKARRRPNRFGMFHKPQCLNRVVGSGPGNHRHAPCGGLNHRFNYRFVFFMGQGWAFAGCAHGHQSV